MSEEQVKAIAEAAAKEVLKDLLLVLGTDISDPKAVLKLQDDFRHVRRWREATETVSSTGIRTAVKVLVTAGIGYVLVLFGWRAIGG